MVVVTALLLNSILRGLRPPSAWAYTQLLLNYDFGFSKRALQGAILAALDVTGRYDYSFFFWYAIVVLATNILLLWWILRQLIASADLTAQSAALVFASSFAVVVVVHTVGYGDQIGLLVTLVALTTRNFYVRALVVAVFFSASILVHETEFVIFFPVVLFRFLIDLAAVERLEWTKLLTLCFVCTCVVAALLIVGNTHMSEVAATTMYRTIQAEAQYSLREGQLNMLTTTFADFIAQIPSFYESPSFRRVFWHSWLVTLPTTLFLIHRSWATLASAGYSVRTRGAAMMAGLAPLAMHLIGVDLNRWTALASLTSFLVYATVTLHGKIASVEKVPRQPGVLVPAALVAMNLGASIPLFDGYIVRSFPYEDLLDHFAKTLSGEEPFPPAPDQCLLDCMTVIKAWQLPVSAVSTPNICQ